MGKGTALKFHCNYCATSPFPHFKALLQHYWEAHAELSRRYEVRRKDRTARALVYATTEDEAAYAVGWDKVDCIISEVK